jgi:hypothetical protein
VGGSGVLEVNTGGAAKDLFDAQGHKLATVAANTFKVTLTADINLFKIVTAHGTVTAGVSNGVFGIAVDATLSFFSVVDIHIAGAFSVDSHGNISFRFTGSLNLDLTYHGFGVAGNLSVTLTNSSFTGSGSVALVIAGQHINVASASVTVNWGNGSWSVYAEGPLSIWLRVTGDIHGNFTIDGGLGVFDKVFEAIGEAAKVVGEAFTAAANAVAHAFEDLDRQSSTSDRTYWISRTA